MQPEGGVAPDRAAAAAETSAGAAWRAWGTGSRTATYRLPGDLLDELDARVRTLDLPLGLTVAAAVLRLLDDDDAAIVASVERVEDARVQAARNARRSTLNR